MLALMLGLFPLGVIATMLFSGHAKAESYLLLVPPAALYGLFWLLLMRVLIFPSEPRAIATDKLGSRTIALSERGVAYTWPGGEVLHFWKTIAELADDGMHLFLGLEPDGIYVIPKRAFPNDEERSAFCAEVARLRD
jgi:hypothetical protein